MLCCALVARAALVELGPHSLHYRDDDPYWLVYCAALWWCGPLVELGPIACTKLH